MTVLCYPFGRSIGDRNVRIFFLRNLSEAGVGETRGIMVVAHDEQQAREMASTTCHGLDVGGQGYGDEGSDLWKNASTASSQVVGMAHPSIPAGVLMTDFIEE